MIWWIGDETSCRLHKKRHVDFVNNPSNYYTKLRQQDCSAIYSVISLCLNGRVIYGKHRNKNWLNDTLWLYLLFNYISLSLTIVRFFIHSSSHITSTIMTSRDIMPEAGFHRFESIITCHVTQIELCHLTFALIAKHKTFGSSKCRCYTISCTAFTVISALCSTILQFCWCFDRTCIGFEIHCL
jgi:hypothetical protein